MMRMNTAEFGNQSYSVPIRNFRFILPLWLASLLSLWALTGCGLPSETSSTNDPLSETGSSDEIASEEILKAPVQLRFATFTEGTAWYAYGASIAELLRPQLPSGSSLDVLPLAGGVSNPKLLDQGKADFAINFAVNTRWAQQGRLVYETKMEGLRGLVGGFDQSYLLVIARQELPILSLNELKEKKLPVRLYTISVGGQSEQATRMLLEAHGMSYEDIRAWGGSVNRTSFDVIKTAFQDGRADILVHSVSKGHPSITEISVLSSVKFLSLSDDIARLLNRQYQMDLVVLPAGNFRGQDQDVHTVGWSVTLDATTRMPADVAYLITKTVNEGMDELSVVHQSLKEFDPSLAFRKVGISLHPGAERYYREAGLLE